VVWALLGNLVVNSQALDLSGRQVAEADPRLVVALGQPALCVLNGLGLALIAKGAQHLRVQTRRTFRLAVARNAGLQGVRPTLQGALRSGHLGKRGRRR